MKKYLLAIVLFAFVIVVYAQVSSGSMPDNKEAKATKNRHVPEPPKPPLPPEPPLAPVPAPPAPPPVPKAPVSPVKDCDGIREVPPPPLPPKIVVKL